MLREAWDSGERASSCECSEEGALLPRPGRPPQAPALEPPRRLVHTGECGGGEDQRGVQQQRQARRLHAVRSEQGAVGDHDTVNRLAEQALQSKPKAKPKTTKVDRVCAACAKPSSNDKLGCNAFSRRSSSFSSPPAIFPVRLTGRRAGGARGRAGSSSTRAALARLTQLQRGDGGGEEKELPTDFLQRQRNATLPAQLFRPSSPPFSMSEDYSTLLPPNWKETVKTWLHTDTPTLDWGGFIVGDAVMTASVLGKSEGVIAGLPFATAVFEELGCSVEWLRAEGDVISAEQAAAKEPVGRVTGPARMLLLGERTALNCMARASGVASAARAVSAHARSLGWKGQVAGTRKFTPGFSLVEKYSLLVGGCTTCVSSGCCCLRCCCSFAADFLLAPAGTAWTCRRW